MFTQTVTRALSRLGLDQRGADPHPCQPAPMLVQKADAMFSSPGWTYEPNGETLRIDAGIQTDASALIGMGGPRKGCRAQSAAERER